jgi:hypothetical protein
MTLHRVVKGLKRNGLLPADFPAALSSLKSSEKSLLDKAFLQEVSKDVLDDIKGVLVLHVVFVFICEINAFKS